MLRDLLLFALMPLKRYCERHLVMWLDFGGDAPPPPDYTPVANASKEAAEIAANLGREQLAEARWQYDQNMAVARPVAQAQLDIMQQSADQARDYYEYSKNFRPLEQQMLDQVRGNLTPAQIVRLGVSGLRLPGLRGQLGSANVIADAAKAQRAQQPAPTTGANPLAPIVRFAGSAPSAGPRFQGAGVLPFLSEGDTDKMLQQQGTADPYAWAADSAAPKSQRIILPVAAPRPAPAPAPAPASAQTGTSRLYIDADGNVRSAEAYKNLKEADPNSSSILGLRFGGRKSPGEGYSFYEYEAPDGKTGAFGGLVNSGVWLKAV